MGNLSRRSVLRGTVALAAAATLERPYIANAAATTAEVWWAQGFVPEEDVAIKKVVADYEKASGNKIDLTITPFAPQRQKIVAAVQSGIVPDVFPNNPGEITALFAWDDKLLDVSDVVETQKEEYTETALLNTYCYNNSTKERSFYGVPDVTGALPNHVCRFPGSRRRAYQAALYRWLTCRFVLSRRPLQCAHRETTACRAPKDLLWP